MPDDGGEDPDPFDGGGGGGNDPMDDYVIIDP
jgi:hypothetical protein